MVYLAARDSKAGPSGSFRKWASIIVYCYEMSSVGMLVDYLSTTSKLYLASTSDLFIENMFNQTISITSSTKIHRTLNRLKVMLKPQSLS